MNPLEILGYLASAVLGLSLGVLGAGGSLLGLPILVYLFETPARDATRFSLLIVGVVALFGWIRSIRSQEVDLKTTLSFGLPSLVGVLFARQLLLPKLPAELVGFGFKIPMDSVLLVLFALVMMGAARSLLAAAPPEKSLKPKSASLLPAIGFGVGTIAGFLGAGGGFLIVPALLRFGALPIHQAIGTSLGVITLQSLLGVAAELHHATAAGLQQTFWILLVALIGMGIGIKVRKQLPTRVLKLSFAYFVLALALVILSTEIWKGFL
jgi:uncharacterized membrane protein YfcA